jgi:hypothetical protein
MWGEDRHLGHEESVAYEVGIEQEFWQQRLRFEVMPFRLRFDHLSVFAWPSSMPQNINCPESEGVEASFFVTSAGSWRYTAALPIWMCGFVSQ